MSLLFETIRLQDGVFMNLEYHNFRLNKSRKHLFASDDPIKLEQVLQVPKGCEIGIFKCRVTYGSAIESIQFELYQKKPVVSLKLVEDNSISYNYKFSDRSQLLELFSLRGGCDEILIVKNGFITDTSFSNIIFSDGRNWITPASPLLNGTMREFLLKSNITKAAEISVAEIRNFETARLINAMLPFGSGNDIPVRNINF